MTQVTKALTFAEKAHKGQVRKDGVPYIDHPKQVAVIALELLEKSRGSYSLSLWYSESCEIVECAALLHDVVEDTDYTIDDILELFGSKIADVVDEITHKKQEGQSDNDYLMGIIKGHFLTKIVKLADITHNLSTSEKGMFGRYKISLWEFTKSILQRELGL